MSRARSGTVLIMVAGIAAIMATIASAFLIRMRSDVEEMGIAEREAQARIMLIAACSYVQEGSRIGYDVGAPTGKHREAFGWIDVRDGLAGPRGEDWSAPSGYDPFFKVADVEDRDGDGAADRPAWPAVRGVARCPMHVLERPPYATELTTAYNPIPAVAGPDFGIPYLLAPDPRSVIQAPTPNAKALAWSGDPKPRANSTGLAWFRVRREDAATFVVTCGAGATQGFMDWDEVRGMFATELFGGDQVVFEQMRAAETRAWYRFEWSAAVAPSEVHNVANALNGGSPVDQYVSFPMNTSDVPQGKPMRSQAHCINMGGTIRWVQRLRQAPTHW